MSTVLAIHHADQIEAMFGTGAIFALRLDDCSPDERATLLDHHDQVRQILERRGHRIRSHVIRDENGVETITLRIVRGPTWSMPEGYWA